MQKITVQSVRCSECEDFVKLINCDTKEAVLSGDYYHNKIDHRIAAFVEGLRFAGVDVANLEEEYYICRYCGGEIE